MCPLLFLHKLYYAAITRMSTAALIIFFTWLQFEGRAYINEDIFKVHFFSYEYQHLQMFKIDKNQQAGVSITIEEASRFEKSNRLYQKEAFTSLLLEGSGGVHPLKISKF